MAEVAKARVVQNVQQQILFFSMVFSPFKVD